MNTNKPVVPLLLINIQRLTPLAGGILKLCVDVLTLRSSFEKMLLLGLIARQLQVLEAAAIHNAFVFIVDHTYMPANKWATQDSLPSNPMRNQVTQHSSRGLISLCRSVVDM